MSDHGMSDQDMSDHGMSDQDMSDQEIGECTHWR
jgi:hypothetical protein